MLYKFTKQEGGSATYQRTTIKNIVKACIKSVAGSEYYMPGFLTVQLQTLHEGHQKRFYKSLLFVSRAIYLENWFLLALMVLQLRPLIPMRVRKHTLNQSPLLVPCRFDPRASNQLHLDWWPTVIHWRCSICSNRLRTLPIAIRSFPTPLDAMAVHPRGQVTPTKSANVPKHTASPLTPTRTHAPYTLYKGVLSYGEGITIIQRQPLKIKL